MSYSVADQRVCPGCQKVIPVQSPFCPVCGLVLNPPNQSGSQFSAQGVEALSRPTELNFQPADNLPTHSLGLLAPGTNLPGGFQIIQSLDSKAQTINRYQARLQDKGYVLLKETDNNWLTADLLRQSHAILKSCTHPALPRTWKCFEHAGRFYHCLAWQEGKELESVWQSYQRAGKNSQLLVWIIELCQVVQTINALNAVCLELKPTNLRVDASDNLLVHDFSLLYNLPLEAGTRIAHSLYVAPEVETNLGDVSQRADIYAIGACWLSLLLGRPLRPNDFDQQQQLSSPAQLLDARTIAPAINRLISRCISRDLRRRYKSVPLFKNAIEQARVELEKGAETLTAPTAPVSLMGWTDTGLERDNNEDNLFFRNFNNRQKQSVSVAVLADGMGGEEGGEIASKLVIETTSAGLTAAIPDFLPYSKPDLQSRPTRLNGQDSPPGDEAHIRTLAAALLTEAFNQAAQAVYNHAAANPSLKGMGSTVVALLVVGDQAFIANVGDSRAYLLRPAAGYQIVQLSQEHTLAAEQRRQNNFVNQEQANEWQGKLARNIGFAPTAEPFFQGYTLQMGDYILLCCDGLTDSLTDDQILKLVQQDQNNPSLLPTCWSLINHALAASGHDNTSVVLYRH